jgi:hypothetical protein
VVPLGDSLEVADSVWLFADHEPQTNSDNVWIASSVQAVVGSGSCGGQTAQTVRFAWGGAMGVDTPTVGGLVRTFETYTYGLGTHDGVPYLIRRLEPNGSYTPLVGPLRSGSGVSFQYLDTDGSVTGTAANVRQIIVTLRTMHEARDAQGDQVRDSLKTRIYTRN